MSRSFSRFFSDQERLLGALRLHEPERRLIVRIHVLDQVLRIVLAELVVSQLQQRTAAIHARPVNAERQLQIAHLKLFRIRIAGIERIEAGLQISGAFPVASRSRDGNKGRQFIARAQFLAHYRSDARMRDARQRQVAAENKPARRHMDRRLMRHRCG